MSGARVFVDTNVLVYAYDESEQTKQQRAIELLQSIVPAGDAHVSTQVLGELYTCLTGRIPRPLSAPDARRQVGQLAQALPVLEVTRLVVMEALRGADSYGMSYWDAQIWATARLNQVEVVLTEDVQSADVIEGVGFVNPFAEE